MNIAFITSPVDQTWFDYTCNTHKVKLVFNAGARNTSIPSKGIWFYFDIPFAFNELKPYSLLSKIQVIVVELQELLLALGLLLFQKDSQVVFSSALNSRPLYALSLLFDNRVFAVDIQNQLMYEFMDCQSGRSRLRFKYGDFVFRRPYRLKTYPTFLKSKNLFLLSRLSYDPKGLIIILHNPNRWNLAFRSIMHALSVLPYEKCVILIHPKTRTCDIEDIRKKLSLASPHNAKLTSLGELLYSNPCGKLLVSRVFTLHSTLDLAFIKAGIPISFPCYY